MAFKTLNDINNVIAAITNAGGTVPQSMLAEQAHGKGWRDAEFYWPCLRLPLNMKSAMYCKS